MLPWPGGVKSQAWGTLPAYSPTSGMVAKDHTPIYTLCHLTYREHGRPGHAWQLDRPHGLAMSEKVGLEKEPGLSGGAVPASYLGQLLCAEGRSQHAADLLPA